MKNKHRKQDNGLAGEKRFYLHLRSRRVSIKKRQYKSSFDFLVGEDRVEVKTAVLRKMGTGASAWTFNIHRHGILKNGCDYYVFLLEGFPLVRQTIYLLFKAPLKKKTISIGLRAFIQGKYMKHATAFEEWIKFHQSRANGHAALVAGEQDLINSDIPKGENDASLEG